METQLVPTPVEFLQSQLAHEGPAVMAEVSTMAQTGQSLELQTPVPEIEQISRRQNIGRAVAARALTEVAGIGVDALLMGAGSAGLSVLRDVAARETFASGADVAILNKLNPHEQHGKLPPSRLRRVGHLAIMMATAVAAQKVGPGVAEHVSTNLGHGFVGHFALPLTSKLGATTGINSILKRTVKS